MEPETIQSIIDFASAVPVVGEYIPLVIAVIGCFATLAAFLPKGEAGGVWSKVRKFLIDWPAMNIINAKNKDD